MLRDSILEARERPVGLPSERFFGCADAVVLCVRRLLLTVNRNPHVISRWGRHFERRVRSRRHCTRLTFSSSEIILGLYGKWGAANPSPFGGHPNGRWTRAREDVSPMKRRWLYCARSSPEFG